MKRLTPEIHGIRLYPQTTKTEYGVTGSPIFIHKPLSDSLNNLSYIFGPISEIWRGRFLARDFGLSYDVSGKMEDPFLGLNEIYGDALVKADVKSQILILSGEAFKEWSARENIHEGVFIPIFREPPDFKILEKIFWGQDFKLTPRTWPEELISFIHMWDDMYWQYFTVDKGEKDLLTQVHIGASELKMFHVDLGKEYPDPSNDELTPIT